MSKIKSNLYRIALFAILLLTGFLSFYGVGNEGYGNTYYAAAVKSMLTSWHNFFFVSFDPGGFVSVDKPALGLWLQALSASIFGFHGWSLILPEALSAVVSAAVLYHLVERTFGKAAGLISALVFSLTPIMIAVSRTNNLDSILVMILLFAAWALITAAEKGSLKMLMLSMALVGLGFNVKMLQAFMVLPAFYLVYIFTAPLKKGKKILHLTFATVLLLIVSLSWAVIVDLTPKDSRPYVGSSQTNSVIELALGYNGIQRVTGRTVNIGTRQDGGNRPDSRDFRGINYGNNNGQPNMQFPPDGQNPGNRAGQSFDGGFGRPGGTGEGGAKGIFRIFNRQMAGQISWLIPIALFGIVIGILNGRKADADKNQIIRSILLWGAWLAPMYCYFSIAGYFHRYYLCMMAPGIAALTGIGVIGMWKAYMGSGWQSYLLPAAFIVNAALEGLFLSVYTAWSRNLIPVILCISIVSAGILILCKLSKKVMSVKIVRAAAAAGFAVLLIAPAVWSYTPIMYGSETSLPIAGPELNSGNGQIRGGMNTRGESTANSQLLNFLLKNKKGEKYLVGVSNATTAAPIILSTGEPVMAIGGFLGSDPILTVEKLEKMVSDGEIRYFLADGMRGGQSEVMNWVTEHGKAVSSDEWSGTNSEAGSSKRQNGLWQFGWMTRGGSTLYDLAPEKDSSNPK